MLYPILIGISENKIKIFNDCNGCKMAHKITDDFKNKAFEIYENIKNDIPPYWLEFVSKYDEVVYDYSKLEKFRKKQFIELEALEKCIIK